MLGPVLRRQLSTASCLRKRLPGAEDVKNVGAMLKNELLDGRLENYLPCPRQTDVLIIGGN